LAFVIDFNEGLANMLSAFARYRSLGSQHVRGDPRFVNSTLCGAILYYLALLLIFDFMTFDLMT
jgi:hypothetical protein